MCWLFLISTAFTLAKTLRDAHEAAARRGAPRRQRDAVAGRREPDAPPRPSSIDFHRKEPFDELPFDCRAPPWLPSSRPAPSRRPGALRRCRTRARCRCCRWRCRWPRRSMLLSAGAVLTVVVGRGVGRRHGLGARARLGRRTCQRSSSAPAPPNGLSVAAGTAVVVTAISTGWVLSAASRGDRLRAEPDRRRAALQRAGHAMKPLLRRSRSPSRCSLRPARRAGRAGRARQRPPSASAVDRAHGAGRAHRRAPRRQRRPGRRAGARRAGPERVRPALLAPRPRLPRRRGPTPLARRAQAQPLRLGQASVYRQGLGEFFLDDLYRYEAAFVVLHARRAGAPAAGAARQRPAGAPRTRRPTTWSPTPGRSRYQQSNQWAIETLAWRQDPAATDARPRAGLAAPAGLRADDAAPVALKRLGARVTAANVAFDDHPNDKRFADRIETVTVDSVFRVAEPQRPRRTRSQVIR